MSDVVSARAKLAGIRKTLGDRLQDRKARYFDPATVCEYFEIYNRAASILKRALATSLEDLPDRPIPRQSGTTDFDGRGYIERHHLERVVRDIDYISEVLDYRDSPPNSSPPKPASSTREVIDVRDISLIDVWHAAARLKLSSLAFLIGLAVVGAVTIRETVKSQYEPELAKLSAFSDAFAIQFANREVLQQLVPVVLEEDPEGLSTDEAALASLLWQVKSQDGFAEFLSGERKTTVQVTFKDDSLDLEWDHGPNPLLQVLPAIGVAITEERLGQLNSELNRLGAAWCDKENYIVRSTDGGPKRCWRAGVMTVAQHIGGRDSGSYRR